MNASLKRENTSSAEQRVKTLAVTAGAGIGAAAGTAAVAAGGASIAATAAAAAGAAVGTPFAGTVFSGFIAAAANNPATWAVIVSSPVGAAVLTLGLPAIGGFLAYKFIKKAMS